MRAKEILSAALELNGMKCGVMVSLSLLLIFHFKGAGNVGVGSGPNGFIEILDQTNIIHNVSKKQFQFAFNQRYL